MKNILFVALFMNVVGDCYAQITLYDLIPYRVGDKWGYYCPSYGDMRVEPKYDTTTLFVRFEYNYSPRGFVKLNKKCGVITTEDFIDVPFIYDNFELPSIGRDSLLIATKNGKTGVINYNNKTIIPFVYESIQVDEQHYYNEHSIRFIGLKNDKRYCLTLDGKRKNEKLVEPPKVMDDSVVLSFGPSTANGPSIGELKKYGIDSTSLFLVTVTSHLYLLYKNGKKGIYGNYSYIMPEFDDILDSDVEGRCFIVKKNDSIAAITTCNNNYYILMPYSDIDAARFCCWCIITKKGNAYGIYNYGEKIIPPIYDSIQAIECSQNEIWLVTKNGKQGFINIDGTEYFKD